MTSEELKRAVIDALAPGPLSRDELIDSIADPSRPGVADRIARLLQVDTSFAELSGGIVYTPNLLDETVWTVSIDGDDAREGFVRTHPQLSHLGWWLGLREGCRAECSVADLEHHVTGIGISTVRVT
jgi:hypothetical protein